MGVFGISVGTLGGGPAWSLNFFRLGRLDPMSARLALFLGLGLRQPEKNDLNQARRPLLTPCPRPAEACLMAIFLTVAAWPDRLKARLQRLVLCRLPDQPARSLTYRKKKIVRFEISHKNLIFFNTKISLYTPSPPNIIFITFLTFSLNLSHFCLKSLSQFSHKLTQNSKALSLKVLSIKALKSLSSSSSLKLIIYFLCFFVN